ncbi:hypothetical protein HDU76_011195 [Blyttiomyces sp. JEL0837]|nr:hypothetical protein HDU76_011195 [Blyttiomyces sp. JEL0837]
MEGVSVLQQLWELCVIFWKTLDFTQYRKYNDEEQRRRLLQFWKGIEVSELQDIGDRSKIPPKQLITLLFSWYPYLSSLLYFLISPSVTASNDTAWQDAFIVASLVVTARLLNYSRNHVMIPDAMKIMGECLFNAETVRLIYQKQRPLNMYEKELENLRITWEICLRIAIDGFLISVGPRDVSSTFDEKSDDVGIVEETVNLLERLMKEAGYEY